LILKEFTWEKTNFIAIDGSGDTGLASGFTRGEFSEKWIWAALARERQACAFDWGTKFVGVLWGRAIAS
jgi:hypothetical protein